MKRVNIASVSFLILTSSILLLLLLSISKKYKHLLIENIELSRTVGMYENSSSFYINSILHIDDYKLKELDKHKLSDINSNNFQINSIFTRDKLIVVYFPTSACPTCYNLNIFEMLGNYKALPKLIFIVPDERLVDISLSLSSLAVNSTVYSYSNNLSLFKDDLQDPFIFLWDGDKKQIEHILPFSKQANENVVKLFIRAITKINCN